MARQLSSLVFEGGAKISGLPNATAASEPVTLDQLENAVEGLAFKDDVFVTTPTNINLASPGATLDGETMVAGYRWLARGQTDLTENGIYVWNGAAIAATRSADADESAEFNSAIVPVRAGTGVGTQWRCATVDPTIGVTDIVFTSFNTSAPDASDTTKGLIELATQGEVDTGSDTVRAVTPATLAAYTNAAKRYAATFGDGSSTQYDITHNLGTRDVVVQVYEAASPYAQVGCDVARLNTTTVRLNFVGAPASSELRAVVTA